MKCPRCGKENPPPVHTCTAPPAIYLAEQIEAVYEAPHLPRKAAAELRRLHADNEALREALKMEQLNDSGCMEDLKEAEKAQPPLTVEALRQDFEGQYKGHIGTTRIQGGRYLSPSIDDAWKAYARQFMQDDTELRQLREQNTMLDSEAAKDEAIIRADREVMRQALECLQSWGINDAVTTALRERLEHGKR